MNVERDNKQDTDMTEMMIEVMPQARQAIKSVVSAEAIKDLIKEKQEEARKIREENAVRLAALNMVKTTAMIEIAPTDTGSSRCIACSSCWCCLSCVSLATQVTLSSR